MEAIYTNEGRIIEDPKMSAGYRYEYTLKDHLGNGRVYFADLNEDGKIAETLEEAKDRPLSKEIFLGQTEELLKEQQLPNRLDLVWEAMEELDYIWDFIDDLRDKNGKASRYQMYFLDHHIDKNRHCKKRKITLFARSTFGKFHIIQHAF